MLRFPNMSMGREKGLLRVTVVSKYAVLPCKGASPDHYQSQRTGFHRSGALRHARRPPHSSQHITCRSNVGSLLSSLSVSHYHGQLVPLSESSPCWRGTRHSGTPPLDFLLQALFVLYYKGDSTSHHECYFKPEHHIRPTPCYLPGASYTPITTLLPPFSQCYSHHGTRPVTNSQLPPHRATSQQPQVWKAKHSKPNMCEWDLIEYECGCERLVRVAYSCSYYPRYKYGECHYQKHSRVNRAFYLNKNCRKPGCPFEFVDFH